MTASGKMTLVLGGTGRTGSERVDRWGNRGGLRPGRIRRHAALADRERHCGQRCATHDDIERVTGRPARRFEDFVRRNAAAWAPASPEAPIAT